MTFHKQDYEQQSPFGGYARLIQRMPVSLLRSRYLQQCGFDIAPYLEGLRDVRQYKCQVTGYLFWRPEHVAGTASFYRELSLAVANYYRESRWEYPLARDLVAGCGRVLELGCGRGYFLKSIEGHVREAIGIDMNEGAVCNKVTHFDVVNATIEEVGHRHGKFDAVCAFHVLEHLVDPHGFMLRAIENLAPNGLIVLSTPNHRFGTFRRQEDSLDLPPHHIGHFDAAVFRRLGHLYGLDLTRIETEPVPDPVLGKDSGAVDGVVEKARLSFAKYRAKFQRRYVQDIGRMISVAFRARPETIRND